MNRYQQLIAIVLLVFSEYVIMESICSVIRVHTPDESVRAKVVDYERPPQEPNSWSNGLHLPTKRFHVGEIVKGTQILPNPSRIEGSLYQIDDFTEPWLHWVRQRVAYTTDAQSAYAFVTNGAADR
jgi:hypothetical protein